MKRTLLNFLLLGFLLAVCKADFLGRLCGTNWGQSHFYPSAGSTVQKCIDHCHAGNFAIAGLIFGNACFCQDDFGGYAHCRPGDTRAECNVATCTTPGIPCHSDPTMICGDTTWYSIYDSSDSLHNVVNHEDTLVDQICSENVKSCTWYCSISDEFYTFINGSVMGSVEYDISSSYCLSAAHDLRYIPNERILVTVQRETVTEDLEGSWRYGIQSSWTSGSTKQFTVVQPAKRVYEFGDAVLYGFLNQHERTLDCKKYNTATNQDHIFASEINGALLREIIDIPVPDTTELYCGLNRSNVRLPATYVPVITQPYNNDGVVYNRTIVVQEGDTIQFSYDTSGLTNGPWYVEKAGRILLGGSSSSVITITRDSASIRMGGFYHLRYNNGMLVATVRVIIVERSRDLNSCGGFRGIPREDGTCLCFPPFGNSTGNCTGICNFPKLDGTFGPNCDINCGEDQCRGILICAEDPFGCLCASGWTGVNCTEACPKGTWGVECKGHADGCKCLDGNGCGRMTSLCPGGCIWGWYGEDCRGEGGYMRYGPYIITVSYTNIYVGLAGWQINVDYGTIIPDGYWLEYKLCVDSESHYSNVTYQKYGQHNYTYDVTGLLEDTCYEFRIQTSVEGFITPHYSPSVNGTTLKHTSTGVGRRLGRSMADRKPSVGRLTKHVFRP